MRSAPIESRSEEAAAVLAWHLPAVNLLPLNLGDALGMRRPLSNWTGTFSAVATVIALLSLLSAGRAAAEKRIALVVGNSAYQTSPGSTIPATMRR
jgi:hypothetical protein